MSSWLDSPRWRRDLGERGSSTSKAIEQSGGVPAHGAEESVEPPRISFQGEQCGPSDAWHGPIADDGCVEPADDEPRGAEQSDRSGEVVGVASHRLAWRGTTLVVVLSLLWEVVDRQCRVVAEGVARLGHLDAHGHLKVDLSACATESHRQGERLSAIRRVHSLEHIDGPWWAGAEVVVVEDGEQAVATACAERFDVVLMDVQMPGMDGLAATRSLRQAEASGQERTPIIGLTAGVGPECERECRQCGMDAWLSKPIGRDALVNAVLAEVGRANV